MENYSNYKLAVVFWEDAFHVCGESYSDIMKREPMVVRTFGVVRKDKNYVSVMTHLAGDWEDPNNDWMKIPKSMVRKILYVKQRRNNKGRSRVADVGKRNEKNSNKLRNVLRDRVLRLGRFTTRGDDYQSWKRKFMSEHGDERDR